MVPSSEHESSRSELTKPNVAELHGIGITVVLQSDVAGEELPHVRGRVTRTGGLHPRNVVEGVDAHAVADDHVVLPDDADLVVVPDPLLGGS